MPIKKISFLRLCIILISALLLIEVFGQIYFRTLYRKKFYASPAVFTPDQNLEGTVQYQGLDFPVRKSPGTFRILVFGGSAAQGFGNDYRNSWGYLLQNKLQENLGNDKKIEIINLAFGAATSIDDYVNYRVEGRRLQPDMAIIYSGWNDIAAFTGNPGWMVHQVSARLSQIYENTESDDIRLMLKRRIYLFKLTYQLKEELEAVISWLYAQLQYFRNSFFEKNSPYFKVLFPPVEKYQLSSKASAKSFSEILAIREIDTNILNTYPLYDSEIKTLYKKYYHQNLKKLAMELQSSKIPAVFIFQPDLTYQGLEKKLTPEEETIAFRLMGPLTPQWKQVVQTYYPLGMDLMKKVSHAHGAYFLNMNELTGHVSRKDFYQDMVHYTLAGNNEIADILMREFQKNGLSRILKAKIHAL